MGTIHTTSNPPQAASLDQHLAGPTVLRMVVGARLRKLREAQGISRPDAGEAIRASHSKISRLELGRTGFKKRDIADLLTLYGVHDDAERATLLALAEQANNPGWWQEYSDVVPSWFEAYLGMEQAASIIRSYEVQFVPGLLQTEDYARAVIQLTWQQAPSVELERRVSLRLRRQQVLTQPDGVKLWAIIDEAALCRVIGSRAIMRAQLDQLIQLSELPQVTITLVPFSVGGHAAAGGPITLLRFPQDQVPDVVYLEQLASALYVDKPDDVDTYRHVLNRLAIEATSPSESVAHLHRIRQDL